MYMYVHTRGSEGVWVKLCTHHSMMYGGHVYEECVCVC